MSLIILANMLLDKLAVQLTNKSDKMVNKYRQLLLKDMQVTARCLAEHDFMESNSWINPTW